MFVESFCCCVLHTHRVRPDSSGGPINSQLFFLWVSGSISWGRKSPLWKAPLLSHVPSSFPCRPDSSPSLHPFHPSYLSPKTHPSQGLSHVFSLRVFMHLHSSFPTAFSSYGCIFEPCKGSRGARRRENVLHHIMFMKHLPEMLVDEDVSVIHRRDVSHPLTPYYLSRCLFFFHLGIWIVLNWFTHICPTAAQCRTVKVRIHLLDSWVRFVCECVFGGFPGATHFLERRELLRDKRSIYKPRWQVCVSVCVCACAPLCECE